MDNIELLNEIYFIKKNGKIVTGYDICMAAEIYGININHNTDEVRKYVKSCNGIVKEIKNLSIEYLATHGQKIMAIKLYREKHGCTLKEAMNVIDEMM